jgi:hypothetical protein
VGVAPAPAQESTGKYIPPGQTSAPNPLAATQPVMSVQAALADPSAPGAASEEAPEDQPAAPKSAPRSRARTWIAAAFAVIGALAIAAVVIGYFLFFRYTPHAERHIPGASNLALRADVRAIATFAPVRKHLWAALFERPAPSSAGKTFGTRIAEATGIRPSIDLREVIVASVDTKSWVLLFGGNFKPGRFVSGMEKVLHDEGYTEWHRAGDLLVGPGGIALGQSDDGTLVLGTEAEIVTAALPASEEYRRMDLPKTGAMSFAVSKVAWEELSRSTGAFDAAGALRRIRHMKGTMALGDEPSVDIDIEPKGGENADALGKDVEAFLSHLRLALVLFPDQAGEKTALSSVKVATEDGHVRVRAPWPLEGLDRGCDKLVGLLGLK